MKKQGAGCVKLSSLADLTGSSVFFVVITCLAGHPSRQVRLYQAPSRGSYLIVYNKLFHPHDDFIITEQRIVRALVSGLCSVEQFRSRSVVPDSSQ